MFIKRMSGMLCLVLMASILASCSTISEQSLYKESDPVANLPATEAINTINTLKTINATELQEEVVSILLLGPAIVLEEESSSLSQNTMELSLFFADREAVVSGHPGEYGFVKPIKRTVSYDKRGLKAAFEALIEGPQPQDGDVDSVLPKTSSLVKATVQEGIAYLDFNQEFTDDHAGGSLGGMITLYGIVLTAAQFNTVSGVMVTVDGEPWSDGHFVWDMPIYAKDLYND